MGHFPSLVSNKTTLGLRKVQTLRDVRVYTFLLKTFLGDLDLYE